jgi:hypothetical protein
VGKQAFFLSPQIVNPQILGLIPLSQIIRVADPDPDWIRIQSGHWIQIRIRNPDPDPDPGGQK